MARLLSPIGKAAFLAGTLMVVYWPVSFAFAVEPSAPTSGPSNGLRLLEEMQAVITELAEAATPPVVSLFPISATGKGREFSQERIPNAPGSGAGVIINPDGHIITNNHVVGDSTEIEVRLSDKTKLIAQVVGKDPDTDLAVLKVTTDHPLPSARIRSDWSEP
jgi:serine protease Do